MISTKPKIEKAKKVQLSTPVDEIILSNFREYCKSINCPMNTILEIFMRQCIEGQFVLKIGKNDKELDMRE